MAERAVYIGGFSNGKRSVERVVEPLAEAGNYDDVDWFTFSDAIKNPDKVRHATQGVDLWTHSAGFMAATDTRPQRIEAFNAPMPTSKAHLIARSAFLLLRLHTPTIGIQRFQDIPTMLEHDVSMATELLAHPKANLGQLGAIAQFNAVKEAKAARAAGIHVGLTYTEGDEYFQPTFQDEVDAATHQVEFTRLEGVHDELVLRPAATLAAHLKKRQVQIARRHPQPSLAALERANHLFGKR